MRRRWYAWPVAAIMVAGAAISLVGACIGGVIAVIDHPPSLAAYLLFGAFAAVALWIRFSAACTDGGDADGQEELDGPGEYDRCGPTTNPR